MHDEGPPKGGTTNAVSTHCTANVLPDDSLGAQRRDELGDDFVDIADQAVVSDFKNGRIRIVVDGGDHFRVFHAGQVLDGTGDAKRK